MRIKIPDPNNGSDKDPIKEAVEKERVRLLTLVLKNQQDLVIRYKKRIHHAGGLLETSMGYAYSAAINDVFKLISKGEENVPEETSQQTGG